MVLPHTKYAYGRSYILDRPYTLREKLHLRFNLINYITCKTILVLFSTNFILALFGSFCGGKKNNKKLTKLKIFSIYLNNYILSILVFSILLFVVALPHRSAYFVIPPVLLVTQRTKKTAFLGYILYLIGMFLI